MTELHLHLDGSLSPEWVLREAEKQHIVLPIKTDNPADLLPYLQVDGLHCNSLNEYLEKFHLPCSLLQTQDALESAVYDLLRRLSMLGVTAAEIRFAPLLHVNNGLSMEAVVEAALSGLAMARRDLPLEAGLIGCCMRIPGKERENLETIRLCRSYRGKGMLAADLAGAEALYPNEQFEEIFSYARTLSVPFTFHAGEASGSASIWSALRMGASRIGHGVHCIEDEALVEYLIEHQIPLEMCPTSNVQTKAVPSVEAHPILNLLSKGVMVTVNSDNMTVSGTDLKQEYRLLEERLEMTERQKERLEENGRRARF